MYQLEINEVRQIARECGLPNRFKNVSKKDFSDNILLTAKRIIEYFEKPNPENYFFILYGNTGVGKSHLAAFIFMSLIFKTEIPDEYPNYFSWRSLINIHEKVKRSFSKTYDMTVNEGDENTIISKYCYYPKFLVFEFGDIKSEGNIYGGDKSPFVTQLFHKIIDYRWQRRKKTLFVTPLGGNQDLHKQLVKHYDDASVGRILEDTQLIKMTGHDRRIQKSSQRKIWEI